MWHIVMVYRDLNMWHWPCCRPAMLDFSGRIRRCQEEQFGCDCRSTYGVMPYLCSLCRKFCYWNRQMHVHHLAKDAKKLTFWSDLICIVSDQENIFVPVPPCSSADWPICSLRLEYGCRILGSAGHELDVGFFFIGPFDRVQMWNIFCFTWNRIMVLFAGLNLWRRYPNVLDLLLVSVDGIRDLLRAVRNEGLITVVETTAI